MVWILENHLILLNNYFLDVRGQNKKARHIEISSHLKKLQVPCAALLETRVKVGNKDRVRKVFGLGWQWYDNYSQHSNGRIWLMWKEVLWI